MTAVFAANAADRSASTWGEQLASFDRLEFAISDGAGGIGKAVSELIRARQKDPALPDLHHGLDLFHTTRDAHRVLAQHWRMAESAWAKAEAADGVVARSKQQGTDARGVAQAARAAWDRATGLFEQAERSEAAWRRARAALELFRLDGRLNDRGVARAEIAEALPGLTGPRWSKVRNFLTDARSFHFLDRMHRQLELAEADAGLREALAWRWWLRHRRHRCSGSLLGLVEAIGRVSVLNEEEELPYGRISAVLSGTTRASSAVECLNGVLRMQQSRHKRMTQAMLDLKRLFWNCHEFRSGPRVKACPYQVLGLGLPTYDFWAVLQTDPTELTQRPSTAQNAE